MDEKRVIATIKDIEKQLKVDLSKSIKTFYDDGATDATVFDMDKKYLEQRLKDLKIYDKYYYRLELKSLASYLYYDENVNCIRNEELGYECFEFIDGVHYRGKLIDAKYATEQIARIVSKYRKYPHKGYGFLNAEHATWRAFLLDEIEYARRNIGDISTNKVMAALEVAGREDPEQFLMHGDFGTHNFLLEGDRIRVIDPMPVVGDYLYDFYFALLSNVEIFTKLGDGYIYSFFKERDLTYRKNLAIVALYVRMSRAAVYDKENLQAYIDLYERI